MNTGTDRAVLARTVMIEFMTNKGDGKKCDEKYDPTDKQSEASLLLGIHCFPPFIVNV